MRLVKGISGVIILLLVMTLLSLTYALAGTWTLPEAVSNGQYQDYPTDITGGGTDDIYVVWSTDPFGWGRGVLFARFDGQSWHPPERLSGGQLDHHPLVAVDDLGQIIVAWNAKRSNNWEAVYRIWDGSSWSLTRPIIDGLPDSTVLGSMATGPDGGVHLVFNRGSIPLYTRWDGTTWVEPVQIGSGYTAPDVTVDSSGHVHVVFKIQTNSANGYYDIYYTMFDGTLWSTPVKINGEVNAFTLGPNVAIDNFGRPNIFWTPRTAVSNMMHTVNISGEWHTEDTEIASCWWRYNYVESDFAGNIHIAWCGPTEDMDPNLTDIFYQRLSDGTWTEPQNISNDQLRDTTAVVGTTPDGRVLVTYAKQSANVWPWIIHVTSSRITVPVDAILDLQPDTLNLGSKGKWITAYIELPDDYDVAEIDVSSILLDDMIAAEDHPTEIGDYDNDGVPDLMVKFDRQVLIEYLDGTTGKVTLTVSGELSDGTPFEGNDTITVTNSGKK